MLRLLAFLAGCCIYLAAGAQGGASPDVNSPYRNPSYEQWRQRFETEGREVYDQRHAIVAAAGVRPGLRIADVGAGTGLFTRLFAHKVGAEGRVYAVDIAEAFVVGNLRRARDEGYGNVVGVVNDQTDVKLPAASVDLVFICDAYHHFERPSEMLASIRRALVPSGTLVIVDFERIPGVSSEWLLKHVRVGKGEVRREIEAAGFRFLEEISLMKENYLLRFARD